MKRTLITALCAGALVACGALLTPALTTRAAAAASHAAGPVTLLARYAPGQRFTFRSISSYEYQLRIAGAPYLEVGSVDYLESVRVVSVTVTGVAGVVIHYTGTYTDTVNGKTTIQTSPLSAVARNAQRGLLGPDNSLPNPNIAWPASYGAYGLEAIGSVPSSPTTVGGSWQGTASQDLGQTFYPDAAFPAAPPLVVTGANTLVGLGQDGGRQVAVIDSSAPIAYSANGAAKDKSVQRVRIAGYLAQQASYDLGLRRLRSGRIHGLLHVTVTNEAGKILLSGSFIGITALEPSTVAPF